MHTKDVKWNLRWMCMVDCPNKRKYLIKMEKGKTGSDFFYSSTFWKIYENE